MIAWILLAEAVAQDPALAWLEDSAERADVTIAACRVDPECTTSPEQLAEAFIVRALEAAALRGELDEVAVSNAEALDPGSSRRWAHVLTRPQMAPEPWVLRWRDGTEPVPVTPGPRRSLGRVIRADVGWVSGFRNGWGVSLDGRVSLGRLGIGLAGGYEARRVGSSFPGTAIGEDPAVVEHVRWAQAAVGPRWVSDRGQEVFPFVAVGVNSFAVNPAQPSITVAPSPFHPSSVAWNVQVGALGVLPVERAGTVALRLDGRAELRDASVGVIDLHPAFFESSVPVWVPRRRGAVLGAWDLLFRPLGQLQLGFGYAVRFSWYGENPELAGHSPSSTVRTVSSLRGHLGVRL